MDYCGKMWVIVGKKTLEDNIRWLLTQDIVIRK